MQYPSSDSSRIVLGALAAAIAFLLAACGTSELEIEPTFDGVWMVTELAVAGDTIDLDAAGAPLTLEIDTGEAALRGSTGCGRLFGSYTLSIDTGRPSGPGLASFTVPSPPPDDDCAEADRRQHNAVVTALEMVSQWRLDRGSLRLEDPSATILELRPVG